MSDGYAARMGDPIIHTTLLADIISVVAETATYGLAGAYVMAAATAAAPFVAAGAVAMTVTAISSSCVLSGIVVGAVASLTGASSVISNMADSLGNAISPPGKAGTISTGSPDVFINGLPAARAAGMPTLSADSASNIDPQPPETFADYGGWLLGMAGGMAQMLWQPVIATAAKGTVALEEDRVSCEKHSGPQYLAEGSSSVFINGHPAVRSGDQTTCGGKVGGTVSPNVIIGGKPLVVRDILSGKQPGLNLVPLALGLIRGRPGSLLRNMSCIFAAAAAGMAADAAFSHVFASGNPVHAATGVKVLNDEADLDFTAPAHFPLRWQRCYNSLNPRSGMHGPGWSTLFDEVILLEGDRATWHEQSGRTLSFTLPAPDGALYSVSEGLIIRRNPQGDVLIADDDGAAWRLFRATPGEPQRLRLATLSD
ncbi:PAAR domain-containing protein, partial [Candidatus Pantoea multigeneris]|nr:type IV secretion protein Rhs [Pantoea multigeneris]